MSDQDFATLDAEALEQRLRHGAYLTWDELVALTTAAADALAATRQVLPAPAVVALDAEKLEQRLRLAAGDTGIGWSMLVVEAADALAAARAALQQKDEDLRNALDGQRSAGVALFQAEVQCALFSDRGNPRCAGCGGPHPYDTSIPSVVWNRVVRARELPEYLCATCIIRLFAHAGIGFTAELSGDDFGGLPIEVQINGIAAQAAAAIQEENNSLRWKLREVEARLAQVEAALDWTLPKVERELRNQHIHRDDPFEKCVSPQCVKYREVAALRERPPV